MASTKNFKLFNEKSATGVSDAISVQNAETVSISIFGSATSFTLQFQGSHDGVNFIPIEGSRADASSTMANSTAAFDQGWDIDVSSYSAFRVNLSAISGTGAKVTVVGNVVE